MQLVLVCREKGWRKSACPSLLWDGGALPFPECRETYKGRPEEAQRTLRGAQRTLRGRSEAFRARSEDAQRRSEDTQRTRRERSEDAQRTRRERSEDAQWSSHLPARVKICAFEPVIAQKVRTHLN